jgi:hypothetical protein
MPSTTVRSLLGGLALLVAPATLAGSSTTAPLFEARIAAARQATSPGGTTVTRQEMTNALDVFFSDDWTVDTTEYNYLVSKRSDAAFLNGVTGSAQKHLTDFSELNDGAQYAAPLGLNAVSATPAVLYGASGALASSSRIREGYIPNGQGVANQVTLSDSYLAAFGGPYDYPGTFQPINLRDLTQILQGRNYGGTPSVDEVDGAVAYITQISRNSNRLYSASWRTYGRGGPGEAGGYVIAAVSTDRRFVRMVEVITWAE